MPVKFLIKVFDIARIFANNHGSKVFDRTHDRACLPFQRRLSPSEQSILVSNDLDENPIPHFGVHNRGLDFRDLHRSPCVIAYLPVLNGRKLNIELCEFHSLFSPRIRETTTDDLLRGHQAMSMMLPCSPRNREGSMTTIHTPSRQPSSAFHPLESIGRGFAKTFTAVLFTIRSAGARFSAVRSSMFLIWNLTAPMPLPAPVTIAILFLSRSDIVHLPTRAKCSNLWPNESMMPQFLPGSSPSFPA